MMVSKRRYHYKVKKVGGKNTPKKLIRNYIMYDFVEIIYTYIHIYIYIRVELADQLGSYSVYTVLFFSWLVISYYMFETQIYIVKVLVKVITLLLANYIYCSIRLGHDDHLVLN